MPPLAPLTHNQYTPACSAERFGTNYRDPGQRKEYRLEARKERLADTGFVTGIDLFSEVGESLNSKCLFLCYILTCEGGAYHLHMAA